MSYLMIPLNSRGRRTDSSTLDKKRLAYSYRHVLMAGWRLGLEIVGNNYEELP